MSSSKIEFEIQLRIDITSFVRKCEAKYKHIIGSKPPYAFLTHWFYYQLTRPFESSDIFIRDIESTRSKELLRELVVIATHDEANADFVVFAIMTEAKAYLKKRASAASSMHTNELQTEHIQSSSMRKTAPANKEAAENKAVENEASANKAVENKAVENKLEESLSTRRNAPAPPSYESSRLSVAAFIARSLAPVERGREHTSDRLLEIVNDTIVYKNEPRNISVKATRKMRDRLKNMYKKSASEEEFLIDVFRMLYRYETLNMIAKETMQLSAPDFEYLSLLKSGFQLECFASPINSHLKFFCSAFKDTDECFGSLGSFFELPIEYFDKDIKCTCDTPYQLDAIELNVDKVIAALMKYEGKRSLEFKFILPYWSDAEYVQKLKDSKFKSSYEVVESYSYVLHKASTDEKKSIVPCATLRCTLRTNAEA